MLLQVHPLLEDLKLQCLMNLMVFLIQKVNLVSVWPFQMTGDLDWNSAVASEPFAVRHPLAVIYILN